MLYLLTFSGYVNLVATSSGTPTSVTFKFGSGEIQMTMPDGERFVGGIVEEATIDSSKEYPSVYEFSGNTEAFLQGDRGGKMRCKFRLSDTLLGFKGGGFGLCQTDDGRVIDIYTR